MNQVIAKEKTNTELAMWLEGLSSGDRIYHTDYPNFHVAAQRLLNTKNAVTVTMLTEEELCDAYEKWFLKSHLSNWHTRLQELFCEKNGIELKGVK